MSVETPAMPDVEQETTTIAETEASAEVEKKEGTENKEDEITKTIETKAVIEDDDTNGGDSDLELELSVDEDAEEDVEEDNAEEQIEDGEQENVDDDEGENVEEEQGDKSQSESTRSGHGHKWKEQLQFEQALSECLTISKSKIAIVTQLSCRFVHRYKDIVHLIEKFIRKGKTQNNTKLPQLYIIDSVCRAELREKNQRKFIKRFGRNIGKTFGALCRGPEPDKQTIKRVFSMWHKEKWFHGEKQWDQIMKTMKQWKVSSEEKHSEKAAEDTPSPKKKKDKKHRHHSKKKHKKRDKHHSKRRHSKEHDVSEPIGSVVDDENQEAQDNTLLASLRSLTNQGAAPPPPAPPVPADDKIPNGASNTPSPIKHETESTPKRKLEDTSPHQPEAKRMKLQHHQNGATEHTANPTLSVQQQGAAPSQQQPELTHHAAALAQYGQQPQNAQHSQHPQHLQHPQHPQHPQHTQHQQTTQHPAAPHLAPSHPMQQRGGPYMVNPGMHPPAPYMQQTAHSHPQHGHPHHLQHGHHGHPHHQHGQHSLPHSRYPSTGHFQLGKDRGIGWELAGDQRNVLHDRYRVCSCTLYIGFWNDVHVDIEKLRVEGGAHGPVLKIMPHPTKPPHKHAFVQYASRMIAEMAKQDLRKKLNVLQFVQKVGWGRPPKLVKESFEFDSGIGEILKADATHIVLPKQPPQHQQHAPHHPTSYGSMNGQHPTAAVASTAAVQPSNGTGAYMNTERAQMIASSHPQYQAYNPMQPTIQYMNYPHYNPMQAQVGQQPQPQQAVQPQAQYPPQYR